jgi:exosortase H (IPTLxxWG-CTERM-specific)|tara:strand:- start:58 stop:564 length:507 start_codon:yes stop_codon:yes gene_type:complete
MLRFVTTFLLILIALFTLEMLNPVQEHVITPFTSLLAHLSAVLILPFDNSVIAYGKVLQFKDSGFAVSIEAGCNGVEATIVLIAAICAFPASWRARLIAISLGFLAIQVLNIVRIISLFYLGNWNLEYFSWIHLYLWPALIMLDVLVVFIFYLRYLSKQTQPLETAVG